MNELSHEMNRQMAIVAGGGREIAGITRVFLCTYAVLKRMVAR